MFAASDINIRNRKVEKLWRMLFLSMAVVLIIPVVTILAVLVVKGGSVISIDFLFTNPPTHDRGRDIPGPDRNGVAGSGGVDRIGACRSGSGGVFERIRSRQLAYQNH